MNPLLKKNLLTILLTIWFPMLSSQEVATKVFIRSVQDADIAYLYDKDYERAAGLYEALLKAHPGNANLSARLGFCYLNMEDRKKDALRLLKQASTNIAYDKEYIFYGEKAPQETILNLALAYHMNDSLEKAISIYSETRKTLGKFDAPQAEYIDSRIASCRYALESKKKPLTIISELFAPWLKDYPGACNPVLSKNDSVFIFTYKTAGKTCIFCSFKTNGQWDFPTDITRQLGGYDRFYSNSITGDGKLLILFMDDGADGNLYFCFREDTTWSRIKSPGKPINTIYWESHGFISPDGNSIYFASNRPGGSGDLDIWLSEKLPDGTWGNPVNCGEVINTSSDENTPFFDPAGNALIFSSKGHNSMGGYDVFRSTKKYERWTDPAGMPYSFNTTGENLFFILNNNKPGFVASMFDEKSQSRNIYSLVAIDPADEITIVVGTVILNDGMTIDPGKAIIKLTDLKKKYPDKDFPINEDGTFKFEIKPSAYKLFVSHSGHKTDTIDLNVALYASNRSMVVNSTLSPEKKADKISLLSVEDILFEFDSYELDAQAKSGLETVSSILAGYPDLKVEVEGYTDTKGSAAYNRKLADKRAQAVINYLISAQIPASGLVKQVFGESNFTAINNNSDGSDNPEGRKYNRRVTFGVVDPQTGVVIRQVNYIPAHLRTSYPVKYSIILKKTTEKLMSGSLDILKLNGMLLIRTVPHGFEFVYATGVFYNKEDADKYLVHVKEKGFIDAYIVNHYDLDK